MELRKHTRLPVVQPKRATSQSGGWRPPALSPKQLMILLSAQIFGVIIFCFLNVFLLFLVYLLLTQS